MHFRQVTFNLFQVVKETRRRLFCFLNSTPINLQQVPIPIATDAPICWKEVFHIKMNFVQIFFFSLVKWTCWAHKLFHCYIIMYSEPIRKFICSNEHDSWANKKVAGGGRLPVPGYHSFNCVYKEARKLSSCQSHTEMSQKEEYRQKPTQLTEKTVSFIPDALYIFGPTTAWRYRISQVS